MNKDELRGILIDQKEAYLSQSVIKRDYFFEENANYCFVGIRRSGKSYVIYQQIDSILKKGVDISEIVYVNFEDERLLEIDKDSLNLIVEIALESTKANKKPYIFLDEIQIIDGWEKFARRLADMKYHVSITGSNSKMLSRDIATTLGGRFMIKYVFPYSFDEFLRANSSEDLKNTLTTKNIARISKYCESYIKYGAFPELVSIEQKKEYLSSVYQTIYLGDIITRNKINNDFAIRLILKKIAEALMTSLSYNRLTNILKSTGLSIGKTTVSNYIQYIKDAFMIFAIENYASKLIDKETNPKYYFIDNGILGLFLIEDYSARLENLVAIELVRRYGYKEIFYYKKNIEVDFLVPNENLAVQVSYSILDKKETYDRETKALAKLKKIMPEVKCVIITNSEEKKVVENDIEIEIIPIWKWLLEKEK